MHIASAVRIRVSGAFLPTVTLKIVVRAFAVAAALTAATSASAAAVAGVKDPLPIEPGTYVREGSFCANAPFAAIFTYDGHDFAGPHSNDCDSRVVSLDGTTYQVATTCRALGDGTPTAPETEIAWVRVKSQVSVQVDRRGDSAAYRRCSGAL